MGKGWHLIARFILKARIPILIFIGLVTAFMWYHRGTERMHDFGKIVPKNDPDFVDYMAFKEEFGEDGNVLIIGLDGDIFSKDVFNEIYGLTNDLKTVSGVTNVISIANAANIVADSEAERFDLVKIAKEPVPDQVVMDSLKKLILGLPFYNGLLMSEDNDATLVLVTIDPKRLDSSEKSEIVNNILDKADAAAKRMNIEPHYSGLPRVRAYITNFIPQEMIKFLVLAVLMMALWLFITFRSIWAVLIPMLIVAIVIIIAMGMMGLFGYKITIITAVLPALVAVIGLPNSIYLLTKYHFEFKRTGNKIKSLVLLIEKIGVVTVMTNATTAVGFGVLAFTKIQMLKEFGILAGLSVIVTFFVSIMLIPVLFSYLPPPGRKQMRHTDRKILRTAIEFLNRVVLNHRKWVYAFSLALTVASIWGLTRLKPRALMVDDLPKEGTVVSDLAFLENRFGGVMPFEIVVNTHRKGGITKYRTLKNLNEFQSRMKRFPEISRSLSVLDLFKFGRQALLSGVPKEYDMPSREELMILQFFMKNSKLSLGDSGDTLSGSQKGGASNPLSKAKILDKDRAKARIKANVKDIGAARLTPIMDSLTQDLTEIFVRNSKSGNLKPDEKYRLYGNDTFAIRYKGVEYHAGEVFETDTSSTYEVIAGDGKIDFSDRFQITGTTKIFIKSNDYLIYNLIQSLLLAFVAIALLMALLFGSIKMVFTALLPNLLPLLLTAGIMGFAGIPLKPSTALIFSVAFGIAVDDTIHYLARFRLARKNGFGVKESVSNSFKDTGVSMIYTSIILFFGFVIFAFSSYGGTAALGQLTSITLFIALFTNLLLLPSLLISFNKDEQVLAEGYMNYEDEREDVEAIREFFGDEE